MSTLTINIDDKLKVATQKKAKKQGVTLTALISQFFKSYLRNECLLTLQFKDEILQAHQEAVKEIENGTAKLYNSAEEMTDDILSE